jgi:hypothetical protein
MCANSILHSVASVSIANPLFLNIAAMQTDPIERFKHVIASAISHIHMTHEFAKPLNPILGETFSARLADGTMVFAEQSCHKPPVTHALFEGPDGLYQMDLYSGFSVNASMNSIKCSSAGRKRIRFHDGGEVIWNNPDDIFSNTFLGSMGH